MLSCGPNNDSVCVNYDEVANTNCHESNNQTNGTFEQTMTSNEENNQESCNMIGVDHDEGITGKAYKQQRYWFP